MSDSFADLWNSSAPQKKPQTLSSLAQQQHNSAQPLRSQGQDLFSLLSSTTSTAPTAARSSPSLHSNTHSTTSTPPPINSQHRQQLRSQPKSTSDAFSDLFSNPSSSNQNLTIAQRSALADRQRKEAASSHRKQQEKESTAWAGLDSLGGSNTTGNGTFTGLMPTNVSNATSIQASSGTGLTEDDDWGLGDFGTSSASSKDKLNIRSTLSNQDIHHDGLGTVQAQYVKLTPNSGSAAAKSERNLWGLEELSSLAGYSKAQGSKATHRADSPSDDFDFGSREDELLGGSHDKDGGSADTDDFMSVFNKPSNPKPTSPSRQQPPNPRTAPAPIQTRTSSPPPHILGQVIEMGFSIPKARAALLANNNDVQAALDQLLASEGGYTGGSGGRGTPISTSVSRNTSSPAPSQQPNAIPRRRDREPREREAQSRRGDTSSPSSSMGGGASGDIHAQAEQLFAQASEISRGMFTKASAFWKEKKEQVQKVVEEHRASSAASGNERASNGRPKWMQWQGGDGDEFESPKQSAFRNDVDSSSPVGRREEREREPDVWVPKRPDRQREKERQRAREREEAATPATPPPPPPEEPEIDLFAPAPATVAAKPHLFDSSRLQASPSSTPLPKRSRQQQSRSQEQPKFQRNITTVPSEVASLKSEANNTFKLGQFGNAEALYTRAIDSLGKASNNNLYFVLLLNNRATARMKIGDISGAMRDCDAVVGLITTNELELSSPSSDFDSLATGEKSSFVSSGKEVKIDWDPNQDLDNGKLCIPISPGSEIPKETVDLADGFIKAIKRRAETYEGMEKWTRAKQDWEWLRSVGWARENVRGEAGRGVGRCVRMVGGETGVGLSGLNGSSSSRPHSSSTPKPASRPKPRPTSTNNKHSEALQALRTSTAQTEAEDQAKHELKDNVDTKLSAWKAGKEANIRALLASLDLVLWEELLHSGSAVKVGMHELVTPAQVKIKYMKAVAKVHPDKLNANNSTLEQRMIAQGVFGALNEAWNSFKQ